jgi:hypothetical protein
MKCLVLYYLYTHSLYALLMEWLHYINLQVNLHKHKNGFMLSINKV